MKNTKKKLTLNKTTISSLNEQQLNQIQGGLEGDKSKANTACIGGTATVTVQVSNDSVCLTVFPSWCC